MQRAELSCGTASQGPLSVLPPEVLTGCSLCAYNEKRNGGKSCLERLLVTGSLNGSGMPFFFLVSSRHFFILVQFPVLHQQISLRPCGVALPVVKKFGTSHCASPALRASLVMVPPCGALSCRNEEERLVGGRSRSCPSFLQIFCLKRISRRPVCCCRLACPMTRYGGGRLGMGVFVA